MDVLDQRESGLIAHFALCYSKAYSLLYYWANRFPLLVLSWVSTTAGPPSREGQLQFADRPAVFEIAPPRHRLAKAVPQV